MDLPIAELLVALDVIAAVSFALSVVFTMLAAQSFDPRLIWDNTEPETT